MRKVVEQLFGNQSGATAVEYALIASLIAVFMLAAFQTLGPNATPSVGQIENGLR
jgi:Flp pilus assembly pilin Flp